MRARIKWDTIADLWHTDIPATVIAERVGCKPRAVRNARHKRGIKYDQTAIYAAINVTRRAVIRSDGMRFPSLKDAAAYVGYSSAAMTRACQGKLKTLAGYMWAYDVPSVADPVEPV